MNRTEPSLSLNTVRRHFDSMKRTEDEFFKANPVYDQGNSPTIFEEMETDDGFDLALSPTPPLSRGSSIDEVQPYQLGLPYDPEFNLGPMGTDYSDYYQ